MPYGDGYEGDAPLTPRPPRPDLDPYNPKPAPPGKMWEWDDASFSWVLKNREDSTTGSTINVPEGQGREVARVAVASACGQYPGTVAVKLPGGGYACVLKSSMTKKDETAVPSAGAGSGQTGAGVPIRTAQGPQQVIWWTYPKTGDTRIVKSIVGKGGYSDYLTSRAENK